MPVKIMNDTLNNGVELPVTAPAGEELKPEAVVLPADIDYEAEYFALLEKEAKTAQERDNYRLGLLTAKGKIPEPAIPVDEDLETLVTKKVQETLLRTQEGSTQKAKEDLVKKVIQENKELKLALTNKTGISTVSAGSSVAPSPSSSTSFWTKEQVETFKKRGLDPEKVKENYLKYKSK